MIFDTIRLTSGLTNVDLPLVGAQSNSPYLIKDAEGLGPSEVDVHIKRTINRGGIPQAIRPRNKEIGLLIKLNPTYSLNQTPAILREEIYKLLAPVMSQPVQVKLMLGADVVCEIEGFVSRVVPNPFSKDPEVQITIPCLQPYFSSPTPVNMETEGWVPGPAAYEYVLPTVRGTAPTPFAIFVTFPSTIYTFRMHHDGFPNNAFSVPMQMNAGTSLAIGGIPGQKFVRQDIPTQSSVDMIGQLASDSTWLELYPGYNKLVFDSYVEIDMLYYTPKYQGV